MKKYNIFLFTCLLCILSSSQRYRVEFYPFTSVLEFDQLAPDADYVFYLAYTTLPTIYISIHMMTHSKPSYFFSFRENMETFPKYVKAVNDKMSIRQIVQEINSKEPNSTFILYVFDMCTTISLFLFDQQGIDSSRVKIVQIPDGTLTYKNWKQFSSNSEFASEDWNWYYTEYNNLWKRAQNPNNNIPFDMWNSLPFVALTIQTNIEYWLCHSELMSVSDLHLTSFFKKNQDIVKRYKKVDMHLYLESLSRTKFEEWLDLFGINKKWIKGQGATTLDNQSIVDVFDLSPKPNIIILGTKGEKSSKINKYIVKLKEKYGNDYDYFFKNHPNWTEPILDKTITILPSHIPFEVVVFAYADKISMIGGFDSSIYMNVPKKIKKFFFCQKKDGSELYFPTSELYKKGILGDVYFFEPIDTNYADTNHVDTNHRDENRRSFLVQVRNFLRRKFMHLREKRNISPNNDKEKS